MCDILDLLERLENKSLVVREKSKDGEVRYRMLESIQQYARERLEEAGEEVSARLAHRDYFLVFSEEAALQLQGADQKSWLDRLEREYRNLRAALALPDGGETRMRLAAALHGFWLMRGRLVEGRGWLNTVLVDRDSGPDPLRAKAENAAGVLAWAQVDFVSARKHFIQALEIARTGGDEVAVPGYLNNLAMVECELEEYGTAKLRYEEVIAHYRRIGDVHHVGTVLNNLGVLLMNQGDFGGSARLLEEALQTEQATGDRAGIALCEANLARLALERGNTLEARRHAYVCLGYRREIGDRRGIATISDTLSLADVAERRYEAAVRRMSSTEKLRSSLSVTPSPSAQKEIERALSVCRKKLSAEAFQRAWREGSPVP